MSTHTVVRVSEPVSDGLPGDLAAAAGRLCVASRPKGWRALHAHDEEVEDGARTGAVSTRTGPRKWTCAFLFDRVQRSSATSIASVQTMSTLSPTFTVARAVGSCTLDV